MRSSDRCTESIRLGPQSISQITKHDLSGIKMYHGLSTPAGPLNTHNREICNSSHDTKCTTLVKASD